MLLVIKMALFKHRKIKIDKKLLQKAENGDAEAQFQVFDEYYRNQKFDEAFKWCKKAGDQGYEKAYCKISRMYLRGLGVETNIEQFKYWLDKACENDAHAQYCKAIFLITGNYYVKNVNDALNLMELSANNGNIEAIKFLEDYQNRMLTKQKRKEEDEDIKKSKDEYKNALDDMFNQCINNK